MGKAIIFAPIELLEERYSAQWYEWFMASFKRAGIKPIVVGDTEPRKITQGQFLDVVETNKYKAKQLCQILSHIERGFKGTIFFMDMWFPGIEMLAYIRDNLKKNLKISGILHAGTWDAWDFLSQNGLGYWAQHTEKGWCALADQILVATQFHKQLIIGERRLNLHHERKMEIVEFPVYQNEQLRNSPKEDIVVFPHRLAPEKQPELFAQVEKECKYTYPEMSGVQFIISKEVCKTKQEYYELLARSKVAVSFALQETFGIAMLEAENMGCIPVAPDRLSYVETLYPYPRFETGNMSQAAKLIHDAWKTYKAPTPRYAPNADDIINHII